MTTTKLKPNMEVIYVSTNLVDKTTVVSINKQKGTATLSNGIILNRECLKKGYFKRSGMRSDAKAYLYKEGSTGERIYKAYLAKVGLRKLVSKIQPEIDSKDLESDSEWLVNFKETLEKWIGQ